MATKKTTASNKEKDLQAANPSRQVDHIVLRELRGDGVDITEGDEGGVRIGAVDDSLHRRGLSLAQQIGKARVDDQRDDRVTLVDRVRDVVPRPGEPDNIQPIA